MPTNKKRKETEIVDLVSDDELGLLPADKSSIVVDRKTSQDTDGSGGRDQEDTLQKSMKKCKLAPPTVSPNTRSMTVSPPSSHPTNRSDDVTGLRAKALYEVPEMHQRYIQETDPETGVYLKNRQRFCIKPPFWDRWTPNRYRDFAEHLRQAFNPIHFAKYEDLPVEEVQQVFYAIVVKPLINTYEARRRGERGMMELFDLFNEFGTPMRFWGKEGQKLQGEIDRVEPGVALLVSGQGHAVRLHMEDLSRDDRGYLKRTLTDSDLRIFFGAEKGEVIIKNRAGMAKRRW
ncbi:hypothetical protein K431DRAFT_335305 [Polychaeton citri CBS 116435]|uniref:Uncharacterized protein n=1 Tax=Polychaeton citri CBS 116435 TaxID=1314669 RepID=A0A9P4Q295_9PEZI|nr:hypothetical protein K431DRAFT_335305 [Polychaeton citri CBS 116435]